jgi:Na+-translocating ferredoxin:NAD+ oxidoreductase subunit B
MSDSVYYQLRDILDKMPNGFPSTEDGLEIRILKKIFTPEEAEIAVRMRMKYETADAMAARTGLDVAYLKEILPKMANQGQLFGVTLGEVKLFKLPPFAFGIYEWQVYRMDRELAEMCEEYFEREFGREFYRHAPALLKVVPVEQDLPRGTDVETYESVTRIIENAKAWAVGDCVCKKERAILGHRCDRPMEICMAVAPVENFFNNYFWGRPITKEEAYATLKKAEDAGLVHMTGNQKEGHIYICNCCECCCGVLRGYNQLNMPDAVAHSRFKAVVDPELCTSCEVCVDRCQVRAIDMKDAAEVNERCIGCGLCISTCPAEAITMVLREEQDILEVPADEKDWIRQRGKARGRNDYKELL